MEKEFWCLKRLRCGEDGFEVGGEAAIGIADVAEAVSTDIAMKMFADEYTSEPN